MREARAVSVSIGRFDGRLTGVSSISIALLENKLRIDFSTFESICTIRVRSHWRGKRVILYRKGEACRGNIVLCGLWVQSNDFIVVRRG